MGKVTSVMFNGPFQCRFQVSPSLGHRMTESVDSSFSSSSEQPITSDLKTTRSPGMSPISSPNLMRTLSGGSDSIPISYEKKIKLKRTTEQLGKILAQT